MDREILIIEDDPGIRESLHCFLELHGFSCRTACHGEQALELLNGIEAPCLIFLDLMMPVMDGFEFLEALRRRGDSMLASIPVTVVSAAADIVTLPGDIPVLRKPIDTSALLSIAEAYCGCGSPAKPDSRG